MNRSKRNLRLNGRKFQFYREIPKDIRQALGKRFVIVTLGTSDFVEAQKARDGLLQSTSGLFAEARQKLRDGAIADFAALEEEALKFRPFIEAESGDEDTPVLDQVVERAEALERLRGPEVAQSWFRQATGTETPISEAQVDRCNTEIGGVATTKKGRVSAVRRFKAWLGPSRGTFESVNRRVAGDYITEALVPELMPKSVNSQVSYLAAFWRWAVQRGLAKENPWANQQISVKKAKAPLQRRSFWTNAEVLKLIEKASSELLKDIVQIAVLSGLRASELASLKTEHVDLKKMTLKVIASKTDAGVRAVPIHSQLKGIFERRCKAGGEFVIGEIAGNSKALVKRFSRFKDRAFPELRAKTTHKQTEKTFHSLRHTFIDARLKAGVQLWIVQRCVGHEPTEGGVTTSVYGREASLEQLRECVEAVRLKL